MRGSTNYYDIFGHVSKGWFEIVVAGNDTTVHKVGYEIICEQRKTIFLPGYIAKYGMYKPRSYWCATKCILYCVYPLKVSVLSVFFFFFFKTIGKHTKIMEYWFMKGDN